MQLLNRQDDIREFSTWQIYNLCVFHLYETNFHQQLEAYQTIIVLFSFGANAGPLG